MIWDDSREINPYLAGMEKLWAFMLGKLIWKVTRTQLKGPGQLLSAFEQLADRFSAEEEPLDWRSPVTNFPVVQNYRKSTKERTWLQHGEERFNLSLETWDVTTLDKESQRLGASPNLIHSFDATHLWMTVARCPYDLALIHDSFGCTAGNMSHLFRAVREAFVEFYQQDPLNYVLKQLDSCDLMPPKGNLDITHVS